MGIYYWNGENKERTVGGKQNTVWHWGVRLYTSPDLSPRIAEPLPEKEMAHTENTSISRYVWLPMEWARR